MKDRNGETIRVNDWVTFVLEDSAVYGIPWCGKIITLESPVNFGEITIFCNLSLEEFSHYHRSPTEVRKITDEEAMIFLLENS